MRGSSKVEKAFSMLRRQGVKGPRQMAQHVHRERGRVLPHTNAEPPLGLRELGRVEELPGL